MTEYTSKEIAVEYKVPVPLCKELTGHREVMKTKEIGVPSRIRTRNPLRRRSDVINRCLGGDLATICDETPAILAARQWRGFRHPPLLVCLSIHPCRWGR